MSLRSKAVSLLSGGLDSTLSMVAGMQDYDVVLALTFDYGQRAHGKELKASRNIAEYYNVRHKVIPLPWLSELLPQDMSARRGRLATKLSWDDEGEEKSEAFFEATPVWVPNRNGLFINAAASFAESIGAEVVLFGANAEEAERFPDNTEDFRQRITESLAWSTLNKVRVEAPMAFLTKPEIVTKAQELNVPLQLIWSCYSDGPTQCGRCPSCYRLKNAIAGSQAYQSQLVFQS